MKTADEILNAKKCGDVFSRGDKDTVALEYRQLAKAFHPDLCSLPNANAVTAKLNELYEAAILLVERGEWEISNHLEIRDTTGKRYLTKYLKSFPFELGVCYVSDLSVTYILDSKHQRFFENALSQIKAIHYANADMEKEISRYMPKVKFAFEIYRGGYCLIIAKTPDTFLLSDILNFYSGTMPDRHAAWVISRLCNLCCFFDYMGIAHNGLTLENCFISPQFHTLLPLGGWWYAKKQTEPLIGISRTVYDVMPIKAKSDKLSLICTDLEASKLIGRQMLGVSSAPKPMMDFLNAGSLSKAKDEFSRWNKTLDAAYGKRQFVEMKISKSDIYK